MFGVLGGMGPLAGVDLMRRIIAFTPASKDQNHIPLVTYSVPQIPDRSAAIVGAGLSPLAAMAAGVQVLDAAGAVEIAIACCTAHHWHAQLSATTSRRILHVADALEEELARRDLRSGVVGLLATEGTLVSGFLQRRLAAADLRTVTLDEVELRQLFDPGIALIKKGQIAEGGALLKPAAERLLGKGAEQLILGCSELGLVLNDHSGVCVDTMDALARHCVTRWRLVDAVGAEGVAVAG